MAASRTSKLNEICNKYGAEVKFHVDTARFNGRCPRYFEKSVARQAEKIAHYFKIHSRKNDSGDYPVKIDYSFIIEDPTPSKIKKMLVKPQDLTPTMIDVALDIVIPNQPDAIAEEAALLEIIDQAWRSYHPRTIAKPGSLSLSDGKSAVRPLAKIRDTLKRASNPVPADALNRLRRPRPPVAMTFGERSKTWSAAPGSTKIYSDNRFDPRKGERKRLHGDRSWVRVERTFAAEELGVTSLNDFLASDWLRSPAMRDAFRFGSFDPDKAGNGAANDFAAIMARAFDVAGISGMMTARDALMTPRAQARSPKFFDAADDFHGRIRKRLSDAASRWAGVEKSGRKEGVGVEKSGRNEEAETTLISSATEERESLAGLGVEGGSGGGEIAAEKGAADKGPYTMGSVPPTPEPKTDPASDDIKEWGRKWLRDVYGDESFEPTLEPEPETTPEPEPTEPTPTTPIVDPDTLTNKNPTISDNPELAAILKTVDSDEKLVRFRLLREELIRRAQAKAKEDASGEESIDDILDRINADPNVVVEVNPLEGGRAEAGASPKFR